MWLKEKADQVTHLLTHEHGTPDLGNMRDPLDELVYIALTRQTHETNARRTWEALTSKYPSWEDLLQASDEEIASVIVYGGFSKQKARWIKQSLRLIEKEAGHLSLAFLKDLDDQEAERFLCSLPGIKIKSARCVLMYSLGRQVLPIDTHVRRVSERVGLIERGLTSKRAHERLDHIVDPLNRFDYHVNVVAHGRQVCTVPSPRCKECVLNLLCDYRQGVG